MPPRLPRAVLAAPLALACAHSHTEAGVAVTFTARGVGDAGALDSAQAAVRSLRLVRCAGTSAALPGPIGVAHADHTISTEDTLGLETPIDLRAADAPPLGEIRPAAARYCAVLAVLEPLPADPEGPTISASAGARSARTSELAYLDLPLDPALRLDAETPRGTVALAVDLTGWDATLDDPTGDALHAAAAASFGATAQPEP